MLRLAGTGSNLRKALTLTEMLVVTAITAILASILPAVCVRVGGKARQAQCASNLRHLGSALQMYADHNDEMHVPVIVWLGDIDWYWRAAVLACARAGRCGSLAVRPAVLDLVSSSPMLQSSLTLSDFEGHW